jgi:hypothetical protein
MSWKKSTNPTTKHSVDCKMAFGRKDRNCPRCQQLLNGAPPVKWSESFKQRDARRCAEIADHFKSHKHLSGGCGVVCTFGEW